jgi:hypothetical protein
MAGLFNRLNAELNPICHLLALLRGATIVDVSRLRVNNAFEGVIVTDELARECKNSDWGLFLNICLKRIRKETKNVRKWRQGSTCHTVGVLTMTFSH